MKTGILTLLLLLATTTSCLPDTWEDPPDPEPTYWTEIIRVDVTPDTVAIGDTLTLKVVFKDSLNANTEFRWRFGNAEIITTKSSSLKYYINPAIYQVPDGFQIWDWSGSIKLIDAKRKTVFNPESPFQFWYFKK